MGWEWGLEDVVRVLEWAAAQRRSGDSYGEVHLWPETWWSVRGLWIDRTRPPLYGRLQPIARDTAHAPIVQPVVTKKCSS